MTQALGKLLVELRGMGNTGQASQRKAVGGIDGQGSTVDVPRSLAVANVLAQIAQVEQRRDIIGLLLERGFEFAHGLLRPMQMVGINDGAVEVHFLRAGHVAVERLLVRKERVVEAARLPAEARRDCTSCREARD